jgi:hypothetical protein
MAEFRLDVSATVLADLRVFTLRAARKGKLDSLTAALRKTTTSLRADPVKWGDPLFSYYHLGWRMYQRAIDPLYVAYAIDESHKMVYLKLVKPFPGGGLESVP